MKKMCDKCKVVKRGRKVMVVCEANPRHKQRQGFSTLAALSQVHVPAAAAATPMPDMVCSMFSDMLETGVATGEGDEDGT